MAVFLLFSISAQAANEGSLEPDVIFQKDVDRRAALVESYPIKLCVGSLAYSGMKAKIRDSDCRRRSDISYDDCMKIGKEGRDFSKLIINKTFKAVPGDVIYLKKNMKYSFFTGSGSIVKDFTRETKSIFSFHTANYGGVALDPAKRCP